MDSDRILAFLRTRLDEDERAARKAASLCGCHPPATRWLFDDESTGGRILVADDPHPDLRRRLGRRWNRTYDGLFMAQHVARHDPARVLKKVAARWRILAWAQQTQDWAAENNLWSYDETAILKLLAEEYDEHPDYDPAWRTQ